MGALPLSTSARQVCSYEIMHPGFSKIRLELMQCIKGRLFVVLLIISRTLILSLTHICDPPRENR